MSRHKFDSGMMRDVDDGKVKYDLIMDGPMLQRWAEHLTAGAEKYDERNWMKANGPAEYLRFRRSALRHFIQWWQGDTGEDHAAAVFFNINGTEYVSAQEWTVSPDLDELHDAAFPVTSSEPAPTATWYQEPIASDPPEVDPEWTPPVKGRPAIYYGKDIANELMNPGGVG